MSHLDKIVTEKLDKTLKKYTNRLREGVLFLCRKVDETSNSKTIEEKIQQIEDSIIIVSDIEKVFGETKNMLTYLKFYLHYSSEQLFMQPVDTLTEKESEILKFITYGYSHKEIIEKLSITKFTLNSNMIAIYRKLGRCIESTDLKGEEKSVRATILYMLRHPEILIDLYKRNYNKLSSINTLTKSELNVLKFVAKGYSNDEVAKQIFLTKDAVRGRLRDTYKKFGLATHIKGNDPNKRIKSATYYILSNLESLLDLYESYKKVIKIVEPAIKQKPETSIDTLTDMEYKVLNLHAQGYSCKGITDKLFISKNTVRSHKKNIYFKLGIPGNISVEKEIKLAKLFWEYCRHLLNPIEIEPPTEKLTKREYEVLKLLSEGYLNKEIGEKRLISVATVRTHIEEINSKFNLTYGNIYNARVRTTIIYLIYGEELMKKPKLYSDNLLETMQLIAKGYSNKEIVRKLNTKHTTISGRVETVYSMTGPPKEPGYGRAVEALKLCMSLQLEFFLNSFTESELENYKLINTLKKDQQNLLEYVVEGYNIKQIAERLSIDRLKVSKQINQLCNNLCIDEENYRSIVIKSARLKMLYDGTVKHPALQQKQ